MGKLTSVPATLNDLQRLNALMRSSKKHWGYDNAFLDKFMSIFRITENCLKKSVTKLSFLDEKLIGFYSFIKHENLLELDMFFLDPHYIGRGYGKKMWEFSLKTMQNMGFQSFFLIADPYANSFYEKMGCFKIGNKDSEMGKNRKNSIYLFSKNYFIEDLNDQVQSIFNFINRDFPKD